MKYIFVDLECGYPTVSDTSPTEEEIGQSIDDMTLILRINGTEVERLEAIDSQDLDSWTPIEEHVHEVSELD